ncbi:MAG: hypothetical protein H6865_05415 [Rhodospirillales bacterium]|nr:hypothetical protein [Alphaproteobacteria bacterium]MCB9987058.1 hypothetical protein [Rhodospirillales bacterium]USO08174.1 MAG: hypothetical protein H6866_02875 [Rhodospirillales bacterium]
MHYTPAKPLETYTDLPIEQLYRHAVEGFKQNYKELAALPPEPGQKGQMPGLEVMLRDAGVIMHDDYSFFIQGAMGKVAGDTLAHSFGMAADGAASTALDIASGMAADMLDQDKEKKADRPAFKRKDDAKSKSVFDARKAPVVAPRRRPMMGATSILRASAARGNARNNTKSAAKSLALRGIDPATRRKNIKLEMQQQRQDIGTLVALLSCGYAYARRVSAYDKNGNQVSMLVGAEGKPVMANTAKTKTAAPDQMASPAQRRPAAPGMKFAA